MLSSSWEDILRRELDFDSYWEKGPGYVNFEVEALPAPEDSSAIWYILACQISRKQRGRKILGVKLCTMEYDGIVFYDSDADPFTDEEKAEGEKRAVQLLQELLGSAGSIQTRR